MVRRHPAAGRWLSGAAILGLAMAVSCAGQATAKKTYLDKVIHGKHMSEITARAAAQLAEFEEKKEPLRLQEAADLLEGIDLAKEADAMKRLVLRRETLETWLALVALIDKNLDPNFNPQDVPSVSVIPPRVGNVAYPPGADPKLIGDPQARQQYEAALKKNKEHAEQYRIQTWLRRFDQSLSPKVERFVRMSYTTVPGDQREVNETVKKLIKNPQRASTLTRAAAPKQ
jgi:hypothetical protein